MSFSRRAFLKSTAAFAVASGGLKLFGVNEVFGADTVLIPHARAWGSAMPGRLLADPWCAASAESTAVIFATLLGHILRPRLQL